MNFTGRQNVRRERYPGKFGIGVEIFVACDQGSGADYIANGTQLNDENAFLYLGIRRTIGTVES
jgi:hypothetical protein